MHQNPLGTRKLHILYRNSLLHIQKMLHPYRKQCEVFFHDCLFPGLDLIFNILLEIFIRTLTLKYLSPQSPPPPLTKTAAKEGY
jgi:hypothetical protein